MTNIHGFGIDTESVSVLILLDDVHIVDQRLRQIIAASQACLAERNVLADPGYVTKKVARPVILLKPSGK